MTNYQATTSVEPVRLLLAPGLVPELEPGLALEPVPGLVLEPELGLVLGPELGLELEPGLASLNFGKLLAVERRLRTKNVIWEQKRRDSIGLQRIVAVVAVEGTGGKR